MAKSAKQLEKQLEEQSRTVQALTSQLTRQQPATLISAQSVVGIRNISDNTIGIPGKFGQADLDLHADFTGDNPSSIAVIPYTWYQQIRRSKVFRDGMIIRDDSILGDGYIQAPADKPNEIPTEHLINSVVDPVQWIDSRTETQIREDLDKITSEASLRRIRRAVDLKIVQIADALPDQFRDAEGVDLRRVMAVDRMPAIYRLIDEITTRKLEKPEQVI